MAFILRRVSVTRAGKAIVRDRPFAGASIRIGRDGGNDIHIEDLAVNPHHATLTSPDGRRVRVTASEGLGFDFNGRNVDDAEFDSASGAELRFGGHRLTVQREGEAIILLVERTGELSQSAKDVDEISAFSLRGLLPGRRVGAWGFALLMLAAFLIAPLWSWYSFRSVDERPAGFHADSSWSSGPLSSAHASLKDDCQSCHVEPFVTVTDSACVNCHTGEHEKLGAAHAGASTATLLAARAPLSGGEKLLANVGEAFNKPQGRCTQCHTEHEGAGPMPATAQAFCADCHDGMSGRIKTELADAADFGIDHPQFRPMVRPAPGAKLVRASLGGKAADFSGMKFPHDVHMDGKGGVARMAASFAGRYGFARGGLQCKDCHSVERDGVAFKPVDMEAECAMCHSLAFEQVGGVTRTLRHGEPAQVIADLTAYYRSTPPSRPLQLGGMARRRPGQYAEGQVYNIYFREVAVRPSRASEAIAAVFSKGGACYDCHTIFAPASGNNWRVMPVKQTSRYYSKGWFDHAAHEETKCADCHTEARGSKLATDLLVPGLKQCRDCHVGGEGAQMAGRTVADPVKSSCAMCHEYHMDGGKPWTPKPKKKAGDVTTITARPRGALYSADFGSGGRRGTGG
ncbi:MAG: cytochrome c3 family protein [Sphingopyxis sp.]|nr:cytochrome c3 family protein [Sphingopyxis sp.]